MAKYDGWIERIRVIKTVVYRCSRCRAWYCRLPIFLAELDKGDECELCGCTSFSKSVGRPIGKKSKWWAECIERLEEYKELGIVFDFDEHEKDEYFFIESQGET